MSCPDVKHIIFIQAIKAFYLAGTSVASWETRLRNLPFNGGSCFYFTGVAGETKGKTFKIGSGSIQLEML
jgi:hypothetical protein